MPKIIDSELQEDLVAIQAFVVERLKKHSIQQIVINHSGFNYYISINLQNKKVVEKK